MEAYLDQFVAWMEQLGPVSIILIFAGIAWLENILPPIPGDLMVAFGGYLAATKVVGFTPLLVATTVASVVGFMNMYAVGWYFGDRIEKEREAFWPMRFIDVKHFDRAKRWMQRWGQRVILANRFLAGTRSVISITAGLTKTRISATVLSSAISSLVWNGILLWLGWIVHENWQVIGHYLNIYGWIVLLIILIGVAARIRYVQKKRKENREK
ncbi:MAG: DedA family protein [Balneolaceae bacterium]